MLRIRQLYDRLSCTYTYIVMDVPSKQALIIDPVLTCFDRDVEALEGMGVTSLRWLVRLSAA